MTDAPSFRHFSGPPGMSAHARKSMLQERPPVSPPIPITSLIELETPHAVIDAGRLSNNIARVANYARERGLKLRPHIKTHKDPEIAQLQLAAGAIGVTVATAREAEVMSEVCEDILVAYPPVDWGRIERLIRLCSKTNLSIALDSMESLERLQKALDKNAALVPDGALISILVEVDLGARRTGLSDVAEVVELAELAQGGRHTSFSGLMLHPGHIVHERQQAPFAQAIDPLSEGAVVEQMRELSLELQRYMGALREAGLSCRTVSGGNTPSLFLSHLVPELTEIRPGTYVFCDRDMATQGIFGWNDCAYSILATVVSTKVPGQAVVDAGTKALAKETLPGLAGYGALMDRPEVVVRSMSEEHGILDLSQTDWRPQVGDRVRIIPNHVCVSVHLQDRFAIVDTGALTVRPVAARGR